MGVNSVLRSARATIAGVEVALAELFAARGKTRKPAERGGHLAALLHARARRPAADRNADTLVAGATPFDAVDLRVCRSRQRALQRSCAG